MKHIIDTDGQVHYPKLLKKPIKTLFDQIIISVQKPLPTHLKPCVKLAYWINVYHLFTIRHVLNFPHLRSVATAVKNQPRYTFFKQRIHKVNGQILSLDDIEHIKIRKQFNEPRIHMALNCASKSCPTLSPYPFRASLLDRQLNERTYIFLHDTDKNLIDSNQFRISKIFDWYSVDFTDKGKDSDDIRKWILRYIQLSNDKIISHQNKVNTSKPIQFLPYDWALNGIAPAALP